MRGATKARLLITLAVMAGLAAAVLSLDSLGVVRSDQALAQSQTEVTIGIDADPTGNTATLLDTRDACISVRKGDAFQVDVTVQDVNDLLAWEVYLSFDQGRLRVTDRDVQYFLASIADSNAFDLSESVPDDDGHYRIGAANITDPPQGASGSGLLARLSLEAVEPGLASLALTPIETDAGTVGPTLTDVDGSQIADSDGDSFFDGPMLDAQVAIDEPCPGSDSGADDVGAIGDDGGGTAWWVFLVTAVGAVTALGLGGVVLIARRRAGAA